MSKSDSPKKLTAKTADRHWLYQKTVQLPQHEIDFAEKVYRGKNKRSAEVLREDFCGTALLCAEWVKSNDKRSAFGLDIDAPTLAWGEEHNLKGLSPAQRDRVALLQQDVLLPSKKKADVIVGYNYSYSIFKARKDLLSYFKAAKASLAKDGIFLLDAWGGWETGQLITDVRKCEGYKYYWEQSAFNPITNEIRCHISFKFKDKTKLKHAFTYDWRYYTLPELTDLLYEAGFSTVRHYWEGEDEDGEGDSIFTATKVAGNDPGWNAYLSAW